MIQNDTWIKTMATQGMIAPFSGSLIRKVKDLPTVPPHTMNGCGCSVDTVETPQVEDLPVISYGLSSYGYDIRLSPNDFRVFRHIPGTVIDPKNFNPANLESVDLHADQNGQYFILPAHSYGLGVALEQLQIPENVTVLCIGKSTYARAGIIANLTPAEAGWRGHLTLEFSNSSSADCRIYANEGVVQLLFFQGTPCETSYEARKGKYQNQPEQVIVSKV